MSGDRAGKRSARDLGRRRRRRRPPAPRAPLTISPSHTMHSHQSSAQTWAPPVRLRTLRRVAVRRRMATALSLSAHPSRLTVCRAAPDRRNSSLRTDDGTFRQFL